MLDPDIRDLAASYRAAGLSWHAIGRLLHKHHTTLKAAFDDETQSRRPGDPEVDVRGAQWRCQCSRINSGPDACRCGRRAYWAAQDEVTRELERQLEEEGA